MMQTRREMMSRSAQVAALLAGCGLLPQAAQAAWSKDAFEARSLADAVKAKLGLDWHETSADGAVTLEPVFCLGLCACGPAAMVDGRLVGRCDETLVAEVAK